MAAPPCHGRRGRWTSLALRLAALGVVLAGATGVVGMLALGPLGVLRDLLPGDSASSGRWSGTVPAMPDLVAGGCAVALVGCWAWCLVGAITVAAGAVRSHMEPSRPPAPATRTWVPRTVTVLVLAVLGLGYGHGGALAAACSSPATSLASRYGDVTGLSLPDRSLTPVRTPSSRTHPEPRVPPGMPRVRVRPGDSLWLIAERLLPGRSTASQVDRAWRRVAAMNPVAVGADPDLIHPDTVLRVPRLTATPGKDRP